MSEGYIQIKKFGEIDVNDPFFDSLKNSYSEFCDWFDKKSDQSAYVSYDDDGFLQAFLYLKIENGPINDISPSLNVDKCLKKGTFKVVAHKTKFGERFIKIITDALFNNELKIAYVTIFLDHSDLIKILEKYGFREYGEKNGINGSEKVFVKNLSDSIDTYENREKIYPVVDCRNNKKWVLSIYPEYHTNLFPDSILRGERESILEDVSYTNSINKVYLGKGTKFRNISPGDVIVMYRTTDRPGRAKYRSVITSLCVAEEIRSRNTFESFNEFLDYCLRYSVFDINQLKDYYTCRNQVYAIKMTYNFAFPKRSIRKTLLDSGIIKKGWLMYPNEINTESFQRILQLGGMYEGFIIC